MRRSLLLALVGAFALLMFGVSAGYAGRTNELTRERNQLSSEATEQSQRLDNYFERARSIVLLTAHNPAFAQLYATPSSAAAKIAAGGPALASANEALRYLEQLYPDRVGEACFIDASGAEIARTVRGELAMAADLSPDESRNPFFAPTFALPIGAVYQSRPYVSPDTYDWVIANSTPIPTADRSKPAMVHFEVTLESFRKETAGSTDRDMYVVDADTGAVVISSRVPQRIGAPLGNPSERRFAALLPGWGSTGGFDVDGHPAAYHRVKGVQGNANHWFVVTVADAAFGPLTGVGPLPIIVVIVTLVLLGYVVMALRRGQAVLVNAASTDPLTGLYNRRQLVTDLDRHLTKASDDCPAILILCDLNGFKGYNDTFGHPAGDALLARLGAALARGIAGRGNAYRIGGDEFCVLAMPGQGPGQASADEIIGIATEALSEHGDGFAITASYGAILLPTEASDPTEAMRLVDLRMYEQKNSRRQSADLQTMNALLRAMHERDPQLAERLTVAADFAGQVGQRLGLSTKDEACLRQAAHLHDIGKVAVPDDILRKAGPLTADEWAYVQQCPSIGERITLAAPALAPLAPIVRSAREHFDGSGYPDRLSGDAIPLGARIVAACSALAAMIAERPHASRRSMTEAIDELAQKAGTQFDPEVVDALRIVARDLVA
jgi:diguanylate cyclase (GGDEF)-like protein